MQADSKQQLETVSKFQLYEYQFAEGTSRDPTGEESGKRRVGLLAQEVKTLIPEAVKETVRIQKHNSIHCRILCYRPLCSLLATLLGIFAKAYSSLHKPCNSKSKTVKPQLV